MNTAVAAIGLFWALLMLGLVVAVVDRYRREKRDEQITMDRVLENHHE